ncbi:MAG: biosynthetic-type acetolactate synthase large subunit [Cyclobacteriaceae bacterium]|nr:biosynthetic-type acetolactate synthase large subunit [Cyclobacteriaceae bacterium]
METLVKEHPRQTNPDSNRAKPQKVTGSEAIILSLLNEGVKEVFGYPGGAIMPLYDELYKYEDKLTHYLMRHEQGAVHAAQGFSRVSGKVGVCIATSGPGATNLITGIADAQVDSTPLVCITGQVPSQLLGTNGFQEIDIIGISMPVVKWNFQVTKAEEIPEALAKAFYIAASGRPGPVLIDITKDAQFGELDYIYEKCVGIRSYKPVPKLDISSVGRAATLINESEKPLILCGHGVLLSKASKALLAFAEKTQTPVASTLLGLSAFPPTHPLNVGMLGMHGNYGPNLKTNEADLLIAIGMRFDDRVTGNLDKYAKQAKVIHIEIDQSEIDKNVKADVAVLADARQAIQAITALVAEKSNRDSWLQEFKDCDAIEAEKVGKPELHPGKGALKMAEVVNVISEQTKGEAVLVTDVGQHQMVSNRYYKFNTYDSIVTSGGLGTMGFALPAAFGAGVGDTKRQIIAIAGDGGIQMTIQELGALAQYKVPVKVVVLNNSFLGMVRQWQQLFFEKRYASTEMNNPDFVAIAKGYGIESAHIEKREDLLIGLETMLAHNGPYVLEIKVEQEENVFPMIPPGASVSEVILE